MSIRQHSRRRVILSAASLFSSSSLVRSQQDATFSTSVKVVNVLATVRNKQGAFIRDLTQDDFELTEDGRPQTVRYFAGESNLPLTLGLMVDTSMSQVHVLPAERGASSRFLDQVLRDSKDQVFIVQFDMSVMIRKGLTRSRGELDEALSMVDTPDRKHLANQTGGGTLLYDAVEVASKDIMKTQQGRKALIVLSDGVDTGSYVTLQASIEAALRADTLVYSILFGGHDGKAILMRMSRETGGGFFEVSKKQSIEQIFDIIQDELRSQYNLGYVSDQPVRVSEFRKIRLTPKQSGLVVQARESYWAER